MGWLQILSGSPHPIDWYTWFLLLLEGPTWLPDHQSSSDLQLSKHDINGVRTWKQDMHLWIKSKRFLTPNSTVETYMYIYAPYVARFLMILQFLSFSTSRDTWSMSATYIWDIFYYHVVLLYLGVIMPDLSRKTRVTHLRNIPHGPPLLTWIKSNPTIDN